MATSNILPLPGVRKVRKVAKSPRRARPLNRWQAWVSVGCVGVGGLLLALSLQHLAFGVMAITGCSWPEGILLATGIDLGLICTEAAMLVASPAQARTIRGYVWAMISATLALSAGLNAWAFAQHAVGVMVYASYAFGFFVPLMVFGLSKVAIALTSRH